jgi:PPM family protein phosphatase
MRTRAEDIGVGTLMEEGFSPSTELPAPLEPGLAIGQHLRLEKIVRVSGSRMHYLINNIGPKWNRRKCWSCGNKYSPSSAQACTYCGAPLTDQRFIMTQRWDKREFEAWNIWLHQKQQSPHIVSPTAMLYRQGQMLSVYPYDGGNLLIDEPSPLGRRRLYTMALELAHGLQFLHSKGVRLQNFDAGNVLVMPDKSVRIFDLNIAEAMTPAQLFRHPDDPVRQDASRLARLLLEYVGPTDANLRSFLWDAAHERFPGPMPMVDEFKREMVRTLPARWAPKMAGFSDTGLVRTRNEDRWAWYAVDSKTCLVVCSDGMGGYQRGDLAAEVATREIASVIKDVKKEIKDWGPLLTEGLTNANRTLIQKRTGRQDAVAATVVAAVVEPNRMTVAHAGDCRAYLLRSGKLEQLTRDHTIIAELLDSGRIKPEDVATHPSRNVVTSGLGLEEEFEHAVKVVPLKSGDRLLFCSDGLSSYVSSEKIRVILQHTEEPQEAVLALVRNALQNGTTDNVTSIVAELSK